MPLQAYRTKVPIRRTGCLIAQPAVPIADLSGGVRLRDWAEQLIAVDRAINGDCGLAAADVQMADLEALALSIEPRQAPGARGARAAVELQAERSFLAAARKAMAAGEHVYCVATEDPASTP